MIVNIRQLLLIFQFIFINPAKIVRLKIRKSLWFEVRLVAYGTNQPIHTIYFILLAMNVKKHKG